MKDLLFRYGRLRSGWRVATYVVASRLALIAFSIAAGLALSLYLLSQSITYSELPKKLASILASLPVLTVAEIVQLAITLSSVLIWRRFIDKKSFVSLGVEVRARWWQEMLVGAGLVGLMWTFIFVFAISSAVTLIQGIRLDPGPLAGALSLGLFFNVLVGLNEELDARGYILQNLTEGLGFAPAVIISAIYFGGLHLLNPGASAASTLGVALFGVLAALAYWATGRLWMSIGMHAAWNFFEGPIYGFLVSGIQMGGIFDLKSNGPEWLTGGSFGPEAGALTMVPLGILVCAVYLWGKGRRRLAKESQDEEIESRSDLSDG